MPLRFPDDIRDPDRRGPNPFADDAMGDEASLPEEASAFAASPRAAEYRPNDFAPHLMPRGSRMLLYGIAGCGLATLGSIGLAQDDFGRSWISAFLALLSSSGIILLIGVGFSLVALLQGSQDRRAIAAGAMRRHQTRRLAVGTFLGFLGILVSLLALAGNFLRVVVSEAAA